VGGGVTGFSEGDRVCAAAIPGPLGSFAEYVIAPAANVGRLPENVSFSAGAGIGHAGIVAWRALVDHGDIEPQDSCLIHGGSGGVGHLAVQLASVHSATVITTSSSTERRNHLEELGADFALDYEGNLRENIEVAAPEGLDVIVDAYLNQYLELDLATLAKHGNIIGVEFAGTEAGTAEFSQFHTRLGNWNEASLQWVGVPNAPDVAHILERLGALVANGNITVEVGGTYDLSDVSSALHDILNEEYTGKLIIEP
jgi:NADPH2:quinone reductase